MTVNRGIYRGVIPKITWGAAFANEITFAQPLDDAISYHEPDEGSVSTSPAKNGDQDTWTLGQQEFLRGIVHRIPRVDTDGVTGWEGVTGWDEFLAWSHANNPFRFYPDAGGGGFRLSYLEAPIDEGHSEEVNRYRSLELILASADGLPYTGY